MIAEENILFSILKISLPIILGGLFTIVNWYFNHRDKLKDGETKNRTDIYKTEAEQVSKQRQFLITENESLYVLLKSELDICRKERVESDLAAVALNEIIDALKKRLLKVEIEIQAWEIGLRIPKGYQLRRIGGQVGDKP